jgi:CRP-like cAMP-binding protein
VSIHLSTILESYPCTTRLSRAGQTVFEQGDPAVWMYRIECDHVRLRAENAEQGATSAFLFPGDLFGQFSGERTCTAEAASDIVLKAWPLQPVLARCGHSPEILMALAVRTEVPFAHVARAVPKLSHLPPIERVIWFLNWLVKRGKAAAPAGAACLSASQRDLAEFLSLSPEVLESAMLSLEVRGYLQATSGRGIAPRPGVFKGGRLMAVRQHRGHDRQPAIGPASRNRD